MMRFPFLIALAAAALVAGCAGGASPTPATTAPAPAAAPAPPPEPVAQCNATGAQFAVGQTSTPQLEAAAAFRSGSSIVRSVRRGQPVTTDVNPSRLTLDVSPQGRVTGVRCG